MAIPSGSGTEVIKYHQVKAVSSSPTLLIPSPTADHIYTVLNITFANTTTGPEYIQMRTFTDSGLSANEHWIIRTQEIGTEQVFVWNDRFSFSGVLYLSANLASAGDIDIHTTYIDQDWS